MNIYPNLCNNELLNQFICSVSLQIGAISKIALIGALIILLLA